jgi:DNA replication initiation complex subunit (GINS family)
MFMCVALMFNPNTENAESRMKQDSEQHTLESNVVSLFEFRIAKRNSCPWARAYQKRVSGSDMGRRPPPP